MVTAQHPFGIWILFFPSNCLYAAACYLETAEPLHAYYCTAVSLKGAYRNLIKNDWRSVRLNCSIAGGGGGRDVGLFSIFLALTAVYEMHYLSGWVGGGSIRRSASAWKVLYKKKKKKTRNHKGPTWNNDVTGGKDDIDWRGFIDDWSMF